MNKYLISVDIEGITGVISRDFANGNGKYYELARRYMHSDVNAVVDGIFDADPDAYIIVRDAHGNAANLDLERIHPKAQLLQGWGNSMNMLESLDNTFKGVFLVGYHAGGQNNEAVLGHSLSALIHYCKINGKLYNEAGLAAIYAGYYDVPIAFISGDDYTILEAKDQFGDIFDEMVGVEVKKSYGRDSALSLPLAEAQNLLSEGAGEACLHLLHGKIMPFKLAVPLSVELKFYNTGYAISVYRKMVETLTFDKVYTFDKDNFVINFQSGSGLDMLYRMNLFLALIYGLRSSS